MLTLIRKSDGRLVNVDAEQEYLHKDSHILASEENLRKRKEKFGLEPSDFSGAEVVPDGSKPSSSKSQSKIQSKTREVK